MVSFRSQRQAKLLSIRDLATAAGVSPQTIVSIESGKRSPRPRPRTMVKLAAVLGVEAREIDEFADAITEWTEGRNGGY